MTTSAWIFTFVVALAIAIAVGVKVGNDRKVKQEFLEREWGSRYLEGDDDQ